MMPSRAWKNAMLNILDYTAQAWKHASPDYTKQRPFKNLALALLIAVALSASRVLLLKKAMVI
jgi:hypothetical protein